MGRKVGDGVAPPLILWFFRKPPLSKPMPSHVPWRPSTEKQTPRPFTEKSETAINTCVSIARKRWQKFDKNMIFSPGAFKILSEKWNSLLENITWLTDFANKLHEVKKFLISFYTICYSKLSCFIKKFCKITFWIKFNLTTCINMWLSSWNIFEENQFYEIKKKNIFNQKHFKLS